MLEHITVLNLASVGPAARAAQWLGDYGARIIQIGSVASGRQIEPAFHAYAARRGVQRINLDLKQDAGRGVLYRLSRNADVVLESFRPGVVDKLGIDYATLSEINPRLVYCSTSGYGQTGPYARWAGHDINYLALAGFLDCSGRTADGSPALPGATVADSAGGGMQACLSITAALLQRESSGAGRYLDVAIIDGVLSMMSLYVDQYLAVGKSVSANSDLLTGRYAWYGVYATRDEGFISVGAIEPHFYANLCRLLELDGFLEDQYRDDRQAALRAALAKRFRERERDDWVACLAPFDTCVAPVLTVAEVTSDPHLQARRSFCEVQHAQHGQFRQLAPLWAGMTRPEQLRLDAPGSVDLLRESGYSDAQIEQLVRQQVME